MAEIETTFPSGLQGRLRGMKGKEVRELSAKRTANMSSPALTQLLRSCWLETLDPGPYPANVEMHWDDALLGDRFYGLIQVRLATYPGEPYDFEVTCTNDACKKKMSQSLDLTELVVKPLPDEARELFKAGKNRFETSIDDRRIVFKLQTGADAKKMKQIQEVIGPQAQGMILSLASRILEVEGLKSNGPRDVFNFLDDLGGGELRDLLGEMEKYECGVETDIGVECQWCGNSGTISFPFANGFLLPTKKETRLAGQV